MDRLIVTTSWDDGTRTDVKLAELLEKYAIAATFYIPRHIDNPLREEEVAAIGKRFEVGAHTLNHVDLTRVHPSEAEKEIRGSKRYLEDLLGREVSMFAYPEGRFNRGIKRMVREAGFIAARSCRPGGFAPPSDLYDWPVTLLASDGSPLMAFKISLRDRLSVRGLVDWEVRGRLLFDRASRRGGVYHLYGHSQELEEKGEWGRLERLLRHISDRKGVRYLANGGVIRSFLSDGGPGLS